MLINGEPGQTIPVSDRGFHYGDGVFETIRVINKQLSFWPLHQRRLANACTLLAITLDLVALQGDLDKLLAQSPANGIVKIIITRGSGGRGYAPGLSSATTRIVQFHELPPANNGPTADGIRVKFCQQPLSVNSTLSGLKYLGRLDLVLASMELDDGFDEGIMTTDSGQVIEGTRSNLFAVIDGELVTPNLRNAGVAGVMREYLMERFASTGNPVQELDLEREDLSNASEMFLCNSVFGVWPVVELVSQNQILKLEIGSITGLALEFQDEEFRLY